MDTPVSGGLTDKLRSYKNKKRGVVAVVVAAAIAFHLVAALIAAGVYIVHAIVEEAEDFEQAPIVAAPQKKPEYQVNIQKLKKRSVPPRPRPIVVHNPNNIVLPAFNVPKIDATIAITGRGSGGFGVGVNAGAPPQIKIDITNFGYTGLVPGALEGRYIDFGKDAKGKARKSSFVNEFREFIRGKWTLSRLKQYYISDTKLYSKFFCFPNMASVEAPNAFQLKDGSITWLCLYTGTFQLPAGSYRFSGCGDNQLIVKIKNNMVFDGSYMPAGRAISGFKPRDDPNEKGQWRQSLERVVFGDWFSVSDTTTPIQIVLADYGGRFYSQLYLEKKGAHYGVNKSDSDRPKIPLFCNGLAGFSSKEKQLLTDLCKKSKFPLDFGRP